MRVTALGRLGSLISLTICACIFLTVGVISGGATAQHRFAMESRAEALLVSRGGPQGSLYWVALADTHERYVGAGSSPDVVGDRLAIVRRSTGGSSEICTGGINGQMIHDILCSLTGEDPAWSPDGTRLAYVRQGDVWIFDFRNGVDRRVVRNAREPAWSPNGRHLAVSSRSRGLMLFNPNQRRPVLRFVTRNAQDRDPDWNPVTGELTFSRLVVTRIARALITLDVTTGRLRHITSGAWYDFAPKWSPDGRHLAFVRAPAPLSLSTLSRQEVFLAERYGRSLRRITTNGVADGRVAWLETS